VLVFGEPAESTMGIGSRVAVEGRLEPTEPGDSRAYLLFATSPPELLAPPPWFLDWANGLRWGFAAGTRQLPGDGGDLLGGLAIGDDSAVSEKLDAAMKTSSLSHLTAVSGANCAVVVGLVMLAGGALGVARWLRVTASVLVLLGFVVLVTPEPSVLRAAVMASLVLLALAGGRPVRGVPVLALATLALLLSDPWLARSYGFVLSVLATAGLLLLAGPIGTALERWLPRWLAFVIAVPLAAQLACQPVVVLLDASLPTYGVVANLLAAPAAPVATVVGLGACVALAVIPPLGVLLCHLAWLPSAWIAGVAQFFAAAPAARLPWPPGVLGVALLTVIGGLVVVALHRRWAAIALVVVTVVYLGVAGGSRVASQLGRPADWQVAGCDVGQGDAFVVRSNGQVALIDTGPDPAPLEACLGDLGVDHIDLLVLTHFDLDHVGGVEAVLGRVDRVLAGPDDGDAAGIRADLQASGATVESAVRGHSGLLGEHRWRVLWPAQRLVGVEPGNDASVTLAIEGVGDCAEGCLSAVFLGDLGEDAQEAMARASAVPTVDVVKVSHHGSSDQSPQLYQRLGAVVGLIGVGSDHGYGHPTTPLLDLLAGAGTAVARTDTDGLLLVAPGSSPGTVSVWTER
jgi:competence protein ComEC